MNGTTSTTPIHLARCGIESASRRMRSHIAIATQDA